MRPSLPTLLEVQCYSSTHSISFTFFISLSSWHLNMSVSLCGLLRQSSGKERTCKCRRSQRRRFDPWIGTISWRRKWQPTPVLLPGKFYRQRSLAGYGPRVHKELDTTEQVTHTRHVCAQSCPTLCDPHGL